MLVIISEKLQTIFYQHLGGAEVNPWLQVRLLQKIQHKYGGVPRPRFKMRAQQVVWFNPCRLIESLQCDNIFINSIQCSCQGLYWKKIKMTKQSIYNFSKTQVGTDRKWGHVEQTASQELLQESHRNPNGRVSNIHHILTQPCDQPHPLPKRPPPWWNACQPLPLRARTFCNVSHLKNRHLPRLRFNLDHVWSWSGRSTWGLDRSGLDQVQNSPIWGRLWINPSLTLKHLQLWNGFLILSINT